MKIRAIVFCFLAMPLAGGPAFAQSQDKDLAVLLDGVRLASNVPALAGAVLSGNGVESMAATGVRKAGTDIAVTVEDRWHLGSDTKAMTAAMIGRLVEQGRLTWETRIEEVFPGQARAMPAAIRRISLLHLLSHRAGLPANLAWGLVPRTGSTREQRLFVLGMLDSVKPVGEPGAQYLYSNLGYVVAAAMAEQAAGSSWEDLMADLLFKPLGMTSAGYGGLGTPGEIDQPWPHAMNGRPLSMNGPDQDNPPVVGPAGSVHCTLEDWAKFVVDQLKGARGEKALLKPETYRTLQTPPFGGEYALGWLVVEREWGGGKVLVHNGSNTMNHAVAWIAPLKDLALLIVTNQGGPAAAKACDEAASKMIDLRVQRSQGLPALGFKPAGKD
jgi:CubicO group peptidase (beta-lactamase class C family)